MPKGAIVDQSKAEGWYMFRNGSKVYYSGIDDPDSWRGPNLAWAWFDESGRKKTIDAWLVLLGCMRVGKAKLWTTSTPRGLTHWLADTFIKNPVPGIHSHHFASSRDNAHNLEEQYIETLEAAYVGAWRRQELEGQFVELGGTIFERDWFDIVDTVPEGLRWVRFWDLATSVRQSADYTVGALVGVKDGHIWIADVVRDRWEWPDARRRIIGIAGADTPAVTIGVETVAFQLAAVQDLRSNDALLAHTISEARPDKDKLARAMPWASRAQAGQVHLVAGPWVRDFVNEACDFPQGSHDDQVDAVSGAVSMLAIPEGVFFARLDAPAEQGVQDKPQERYSDAKKRQEQRQNRGPWRTRGHLWSGSG